MFVFPEEECAERGFLQAGFQEMVFAGRILQKLFIKLREFKRRNFKGSSAKTV